MDLTVASGFKSKPPFQPNEEAELPDRLPAAGAAPPSPQPDCRFSLDHTESACISSTSPAPPLNSSNPNAPTSSSLLDEDFRPETSMDEDYRPETHLHEDYRPETHMDSNYRPQTNLDEDLRPETNMDEDYKPETNMDNDYRPETNMYDPFSPTECEKEDGAADAEDAVADKYDPFEPTGSPVSDNNVCNEDLKDQVEMNQTENSEQPAKLEEPPDSTEALAASPNCSPDLLSIRRTVDCTAVKEEHTDSEHSEIEEGEIVGLFDREAGVKRIAGEHYSEGIDMNSPNSAFFGPKPERILRVLDGDGFVSVRADPDWQPEREPDNEEEEPEMGVEDLRRKLVSRRKERYITFPGATALSPEATTPASGHLRSPPPSPTLPALDDEDKAGKSSKGANESEKIQKSKERKSGGKEERRKKKRKEKRSQRKSKDKPGSQKSRKDSAKAKRSNRSRSSKRKKRRRSPQEIEAERSFSKVSEERQQQQQQQQRDSSRQRDRETRHRSRDRNRDRSRDRHRERDRSRERNRERSRSRDRDRHWDRDRARERERERERDRDREQRRSQRNDDASPRDRARKRRRDSRSRSRERDGAHRSSRRSSERNEGERDRQRERERRGRDGRPVVPPSIQDLNGSDLYAIKRTITVTTTTTTTTVPGSPRHDSPSDVDKSHRKKKRKGRSSPENDRGRRSRSRSLSPPRYHNYESDRYSDKLDIDVLSLDGEALDSDYDYPSLEDTPPPAPPPLPLPSPKAKPASKSSQLKRKATKKNSESARTKSKNLSSDPISSALPGVKRARKVKDKTRDKGSRKELGRSSKSKKDGSSRKGKLQSKVSVLVREGVSSTTGSSGKLGMDLLGTGGPGSGAGGSVVGGSIAVVFCRDNESRSPFLKPCSEPLSLGGRGKDLGSMGKRSSLAAPPNSSASAPLPSQKPGSITSTSSSASSPSSSLVTKRRRRVVKKTRDKVGSAGSKADDGNQGAAGVWSEPQATPGESLKAASPHHHAAPAGSVPCSSSSSSSSTSVLPPSSSPPPSPPPLSSSAAPPLRESSPDSQTVDSSCKTPEPSFLLLPEEPHSSQTSPALLPPPSPSLILPGLSLTPTEPPKAPCSPPPCPSSSGAAAAAACGLSSLSSLSSLSLDPSSSSVSSSSATKPPPPPPPPAAPPALNWGLQTGVDCTAGGVLALTALLFKMEEANIASRAKAQEFIQATSQILSQANQSQSTPLSSSASQAPPPPSIPPPPRLSPTQLFLHNSAHLHPCAQTPPPISLVGGDSSWDNDSKDPDKYLKKLHTQERAVEEVKLAIKPYYQRKDINKDEYKDILRKAVHKICHSRTGEINPVKVSNLVKLYVQRYKYFRKHGRKMDDDRDEPGLHSSA